MIMRWTKTGTKREIVGRTREEALDHIRILEFWLNEALVLTNEDEISVEELRKKDTCPFWVKEGMRKLELKSTRNVFFKREGDQWAFSLRKG